MVAVIRELQVRCGAAPKGVRGYGDATVRPPDVVVPEAVAPDEGTSVSILWNTGPAIRVAGPKDSPRPGRADCAEKILRAMRIRPPAARDEAIAEIALEMKKKARSRAPNRLSKLFASARTTELKARVLLEHCHDFVPTAAERRREHEINLFGEPQLTILPDECRRILARSRLLKESGRAVDERLALLLPAAMRQPGLVNDALKKFSAATGRDFEISVAGRWFDSDKTRFSNELEAALRRYCAGGTRAHNSQPYTPRYHRVGRDGVPEGRSIDCRVRSRSAEGLVAGFKEGLLGLFEGALVTIAAVGGLARNVVSELTEEEEAALAREVMRLARTAANGDLAYWDRVAVQVALGHVAARVVSAGDLAIQVAEGVYVSALEIIGLLCRVLRGDTKAIGELAAITAASVAGALAVKILSKAGVKFFRKVRRKRPRLKPGEWKLRGEKSSTKWANQMKKRGWTPQQIDEAISNGKMFSAENNINPGNPATRYVHPKTGRSVVIDDVSKEVLHVGGDGFKY